MAWRLVIGTIRLAIAAAIVVALAIPLTSGSPVDENLDGTDYTGEAICLLGGVSPPDVGPICLYNVGPYPVGNMIDGPFPAGMFPFGPFPADAAGVVGSSLNRGEQ